MTSRLHTSIIFAVCAILVIGVSIYVHRENLSAPGQAQQAPPAAIRSDVPIVTNDDWKKTFFTVSGTPVTGDVSDTAIAGSLNATSSPLTATDRFGREFFSKYMILKQAGIAINSDLGKATVQGVADSSLDLAAQIPQYSTSDLSIIADETPASLRRYGNAVAEAVYRHAPSGNDAIIAKDAMEKSDPVLLQGIDPIIGAYTAMRDELLRTAVPRSATNAHLDLVNSVSEALYNAIAFRHVFDDPLPAIGAVARYQDTESSFFAAMVNLRAYFQSSGTAFDSADSAYAIFHS